MSTLDDKVENAIREIFENSDMDEHTPLDMEIVAQCIRAAYGHAYVSALTDDDVDLADAQEFALVASLRLPVV